MQTEKDEEIWVLTKFGCLQAIMNEYGVKFDRELTPRMKERFMNDLLDQLVFSGHLISTSNEDKNE